MKWHNGSDSSLRDLSFDTLFALIVCRMAYSQGLDLKSILVQLEEQFVSTEGEYEAFEDQGTLATAFDSYREVETTAFGPISAVEHVEMVLAREGEEDDLEPLNHRPEGTILPQTTDVDSTTCFNG